jgi:predicted HTH domain antitoxin
MAQETVQVTIEVPAELADEGTAGRARRLLVLDAVRDERMSWRAAARLLDLTPLEFLDLAREHGVPVHRYDDADLQQDLSTLDRIGRWRPDVG